MKKKALKKLAAFTAAATMLMSGMTVFADETYTTQTGDSLSKIAKQFYGDADKWEDIYNSNKDQIKNPNIIWANQTLIIPNADTTQATDTTQTTDTTQATDTTQTTVDVTSPVNAADASDFIKKVYALMSAQDYTSMLEVDGSDEAEAYVSAMVSDRAVYTPDGSGNGVGAGVYKIPNDGGYYFYYGGYAGGGRTGDGIIFMDCGDYYYLFTGTWSNDAPNGNGTVKYIYLDGSHNTTINGNLVNGLWNGKVSDIVYDARFDYNFDLSFTANNGQVVEDVTEEFLYNVVYDWGVNDSYLSEHENGEKKVAAYDAFYYFDVGDGGDGGDSGYFYWFNYDSNGTEGIVGFAANY